MQVAQPALPSPLGTVDTSGMRFAIVVSQFNAGITNALLDGARRGFADCGVSEQSITVTFVPGAFEIPLAAQTLARTGQYDAVVALGAVIRGETPHFDYVAGSCARGLQDVALHTDMPVMFGVLTTDNLDQATARCGNDRSNKGWECAAGAIEMAAFMRKTRARK